MSHKATTYVTLDSTTYEIEGTYYERVAGDRETPPEPEHFEIDRVFADLKTQKDPDKVVTVDVTDLITEATHEELNEKLNENLDTFTEHPDY